VPVFHGHKRIRLTSFAKDNSVPGSKQTATYLFSGAANPRVCRSAQMCDYSLETSNRDRLKSQKQQQRVFRGLSQCFSLFDQLARTLHCSLGFR